MPCPFLTRLSANYVRNYAPSLLKAYGNLCPVISSTMCTMPATKPEGKLVIIVVHNLIM